MSRTRFEYRPGPMLGEGGSATVHAGSLPDGRELAVKQLAAGVSEEVLIREAKVLSRLQHRNVVKFYALQPTEDDPDVLELITERVQGVDLATLSKAGRLPPNVAVYVMRQVLEALAYVHGAENVVHRDLSPRNILVCEDGAVKVADFGIAKLVGVERTTRGVRGTPSYISPEQLGGHERLDGRSDLFAVGVNLYQLLTGESPFGEERSEQLEGLPVSPLTARCPELPEELNRAVLAMLELDRDRRPGSAQEALQSLPESPCGRATLVWWMRRRGLSAMSGPVPEREPRRAWAAGIALAVGVALGGIAMYLGISGMPGLGPAGEAAAERAGEHHATSSAALDSASGGSEAVSGAAAEGGELAPVLLGSAQVEQSAERSIARKKGDASPSTRSGAEARPRFDELATRTHAAPGSRDPRAVSEPENQSADEVENALKPEKEAPGATYHLPIRSGESVYFPPEGSQKTP